MAPAVRLSHKGKSDLKEEGRGLGMDKSTDSEALEGSQEFFPGLRSPPSGRSAVPEEVELSFFLFTLS